jgi:hypothetical protein
MTPFIHWPMKAVTNGHTLRIVFFQKPYHTPPLDAMPRALPRQFRLNAKN